jgi:hypothetical protein
MKKIRTPYGYYYWDKKSSDYYRRILEKCAEGLDDNEQSFEQAFSSLAYNVVKDKSPRLLDFVIGFQLVERNEDKTKAFGVFGCKVGEQWLYIPIFFLNGDLKGHEVLWIKNENLCVPLKESWINHLIARKPLILGDADNVGERELRGNSPNLRTLFGLNKYSYELPFQEWSYPFLRMVSHIDVNRKKILEKKGEFSLDKKLDSLPLFVSLFENAYLKYPKIKKGFDSFYGPHFFSSLLEKNQEKFAKEIIIRGFKFPAIRPKKKKIIFIDPELEEDKEEETKKKEPVKNGEMKMIIQRVIITGKKKKPQDDPFLSCWPCTLPDEEEDDEEEEDSELEEKEETSEGSIFDHIRESFGPMLPESLSDILENMADAEKKEKVSEKEASDLLVKGYTLIDKRAEDKKSIAYKEETNSIRFNSPDRNGLYKIVLKDGTLKSFYVIHPLKNPFGRDASRNCLLISKDKEKPEVFLHNISHVYAVQEKKKGNEDEDSLADLYLDLSKVVELERGEYCFVRSQSGGIGPLRISETLGEDTYAISDCYLRDKSPESTEQVARIISYPYVKYLRVTNGSSGTPKVVGETLYLPDSYMAIPLDTSGECQCVLGTPEDFRYRLRKSALDIHYLGGKEYEIKSRHGRWRLEKRAAIKNLFEEHGLGEGQILEMLKEAYDKKGGVRYLIKYAEPFDPENNKYYAPAFPTPVTYSQDLRNGRSVTAQYKQDFDLPITSLRSEQPRNPEDFEPYYQPDREALQLAQQAVNSGQKDIFDVSMFVSLLKEIDQDAKIEEDLGDFMKALDKMGKRLLLLYWHPEEYEERYGQEDLPELEDALRNCFEMLGDVVLFLKKKSVKGDLELVLPSVGNYDDPDIDSAANV